MPATEHGPIFIFASGQRCGSTLLQRFLSSQPDTIIWGEHDGVLAKMFAQFDRLYEWREMFGHQFQLFVEDGYNNFIPNMNPDPEYIREAQIQLVRNIWEAPAHGMGKQIWGFKEVLYDAEMALRLHDLFPSARIIHLTRNIFECFISLRYEEEITPEEQQHVPLKQVWTRARTIEFIETWLRVNESLLYTPGLESSWFYHLSYENLVKSPTEVTCDLVDWLNMEIREFDMDVFKHKLYTDRHKGPDPRPKVRRADLTDEEVALITTEPIMKVSELLNYDMSI